MFHLESPLSYSPACIGHLYLDAPRVPPIKHIQNRFYDFPFPKTTNTITTKFRCFLLFFILCHPQTCSEICQSSLIPPVNFLGHVNSTPQSNLLIHSMLFIPTTVSQSILFWYTFGQNKTIKYDPYAVALLKTFQ